MGNKSITPIDFYVSVQMEGEAIQMKGKAVQIVRVQDDHTLRLMEENLSAIIHQPDVKDKPVVVVTVAGAFRKGKSYLLNFFLRYLMFITSQEVRLL